MQPKRILVVDDHHVVRLGLRNLIDCSDDLKVVGELAHGDEVEKVVAKTPADLLILDIAMPDKSGIQVLQTLRRNGHTLPILIFSMHPSAQYADFVRRHGAQGFIDKGEEGAEMLRAIRQIVAGETYFPNLPGDEQRTGGPFATLSRRESEVLNGILRGDSLQSIAAALSIGPKSVSTYRRRLLDKLGVESNAELAAMATRYPEYDFCLSASTDRQK